MRRLKVSPRLLFTLIIIATSSFLTGYISNTVSNHHRSTRHHRRHTDKTRSHTHTKKISPEQEREERRKVIALQTVQSFQSIRCPDVVKPEEMEIEYGESGPHWQRFRSGNDTTYLYRAYFDDRPATDGLPIVRILGISMCTPEVSVSNKTVYNDTVRRLMHYGNQRTNCTFYCQVWSADGDVMIVYAHQFRINRLYRFMGGNTYGQYMFSCRLPKDATPPTHVSLVTSPCDHSSVLLPVIAPDKARMIPFGVCVSIGYGNIDPRDLVEWFEFYRLMGVSEFNLYNATLSADLIPVLDYYVQAGVLQLTQMRPAENSSEYMAIKTCEVVSVNDCHYRNLYRYSYVISVDFDEFIVPKRSKNYFDMMKLIMQQVKYPQFVVSYTFRNQYHFLNFTEDTTKPAYLRTLRHPRYYDKSRWSTDKSFVNPLLCQSLYNHFCMWPFRIRNTTDANSTKTVVMVVTVSQRIAANQHYRWCTIYSCSKILKSKSRHIDKTMLKFYTLLDANTLFILQKLQLLSNSTENIIQTSNTTQRPKVTLAQAEVYYKPFGGLHVHR